MANAQHLTTGHEASTEKPLVVFISSVMGTNAEDLSSLRLACQEAINSLRLTRAWTFEGSPASTESLPGFYLNRIEECDIFVLILGKEITNAVENEYSRAVAEGKPRLVFVKPERVRSKRASQWLSTRSDVKWDDNFADEAEFGQRVRIAIGDELIRSYRKFRLAEKDFSVIAGELRSEAKSFMVRTITARELTHMQERLPQLEERYPDFATWLSEKSAAIVQGAATAYVASFADQITGLAIVVPKGRRVKKISTLYIHPQYQGLGIGPRLLFALIEDASRDGTEKLYVTLADETLPQLAPLLEHFGFFVEGIAGRRYRAGSPEWVWSKRLLRGYVPDRRFSDFVRHYLFEERGNQVAEERSGAFISGQPFDFLGRHQHEETHLVVVDSGESDASSAYKAAREQARQMEKELLFVSKAEGSLEGDWLDALDLELRFFPLFVQTKLDGLILPIQEGFANALIPKANQLQLLIPSRLQLRTDNVYYRFPNQFQGLGRGSSLLFFETQRSSGWSLLVGEAKLIEYAVDYPEELLSRFGNLGVYTLEDLREHVAPSGPLRGKALALRFDFYRELPRPLSANAIREVVPTFEPRGPRRITPDELRELRELAGWEVGDICFP